MIRGTLIKQPNEKYCFYDVLDRKVKHYNLTEQDVINMYIEDAKSNIGEAEHYGNLIANTIGYKGSLNKISDNILKEMGFNKTYNELVKYVPLEPINQTYVPCDFTTYAKCPSCGGSVQNCMGHKDEKCKCGQLLKW